ncbi:MAG: hypothetical protein M1429_01610 [Patescibacteria group bacterium]|nr:hypothetical protein [Patescibacteria group bacterium]
MPEILTRPEIEEENLESVAQGAEEEINDILLGKDFSVYNLTKLKYKLLENIESHDNLDQEEIQDALNKVIPQNESKKTFLVDVQGIVDIVNDLVDDPRSYRLKNPSKIHSLMAFCHRFNKEQ